MRPTGSAGGGSTRLAQRAGRLVGALDPRGRRSLEAYRRLVPRLLAGAAGVVCVAVPLAASGARIPALVLAGGLPILAAAALAQTVRRFHDRGLSGWWLVPNPAIWAASLAPFEAWADRYPVAVLAYAAAAWGFTLWCLVEALGRPGTPGPNRYGTAPRPPGP